MKTTVLDHAQTLEKNLEGARKLYEAVKVTMGPRGLNVIFKKAGKRVGVTHDGVTVAKAFEADDALEAVGAELLKEAAMRLDSITGDGTTTVTVLAYHILKNALEEIRGGKNAMVSKLELERLQKVVMAKLEENVTYEVDLDTLEKVATTAAGDSIIGKEVAGLIYEAGHETPILLDFSDDERTYSEVIQGFKINSGAASPYLLEGVKTELGPSYVVVCDAKMRDKDDILPILRLMAAMPSEQKSLLLVVSDIAGDALQLAIVNRLKGSLGLAVAKVPAGINSHAEYLEDVAISTGAVVLTRNSGNTLADPTAENFGRCDKVIIEPGSTVIVNGKADPEVHGAHLLSLAEMAKDGKTAVARQFAKDRLTVLSRSIVSVRVGGQSESEAEERHYRFEDAVGACKAALRGGVLPGGGTVLYSIGRDLKDSVLGLALMQPTKVILGSMGLKDEDYLIDPGFGVNILNPEEGVVDMIEAGVLDPAESEKESVKTAISIASLLMTSGGMIVDEEEKNETQKQVPHFGFGPNQG